MKSEILWRKAFLDQMGLSLEWKDEQVKDGDSEDRDCDEMIFARWGEPGGL